MESSTIPTSPNTHIHIALTVHSVDENVVIGSSPSSADKQSVTDFGSIEAIGEKLAKKR